MEKRRKGGKRTRKRGRSEVTEKAFRVVQLEFNLGTEVKMSSQMWHLGRGDEHVGSREQHCPLLLLVGIYHEDFNQTASENTSAA